MPQVDLERGARLEFRFAGESDVAAVVDLVQSSYRGDRSRQGWTTEADLLDGQRTDAREVADVVRSPDGHLLLATFEEGLAGCCQLARHDDATVYLGMFAVRPRLQGKGVGDALRAEAERIAREVWASQRMRLVVIRQREELIGWYERRGFSRTGEKSPFPYGDERFGIPRRADLEFAVLVKRLT